MNVIVEDLKEYCTELRDALRDCKDLDARSETHKQYMEAVENLRNAVHDMNEFEDKAERREIDREKNEQSAEIERSKQKLTPGRAILEGAKIVVPVAVSAVVALKMQDRAGSFEETGRWNSDASRMAHNQAPRLSWK